jgi:hypothetical protein
LDIVIDWRSGVSVQPISQQNVARGSQGMTPQGLRSFAALNPKHLVQKVGRGSVASPTWRRRGVRISVNRHDPDVPHRKSCNLQ